MSNLWFFSHCGTCQAYERDKSVEGFDDGNPCEKYFSCVHREKCIKARQENQLREREDRINKMLSDHPYDSYRKAVINEIKRYIKVLEVKEQIDSYQYEICRFVLRMPFDFHYAISFQKFDDYHILYDWSVQQLAYDLVVDIRQSFLDVTLNKKEK